MDVLKINTIILKEEKNNELKNDWVFHFVMFN